MNTKNKEVIAHQENEPSQVELSQVSEVSKAPKISGAMVGLGLTVKTTTVPTLPAQDIERLHRISPDYADRAIALIENEAEFRHEYSFTRERDVTRERLLGLKLGALIAIVGIFAGVALAYIGHPYLALILFTSALVGIVSLIVAYSHDDIKANKSNPKKADRSS